MPNDLGSLWDFGRRLSLRFRADLSLRLAFASRRASGRRSLPGEPDALVYQYPKDRLSRQAQFCNYGLCEFIIHFKILFDQGIESDSLQPLEEPHAWSFDLTCELAGSRKQRPVLWCI